MLELSLCQRCSQASTAQRNSLCMSLIRGHARIRYCLNYLGEEEVRVFLEVYPLAVFKRLLSSNLRTARIISDNALKPGSITSSSFQREHHEVMLCDDRNSLCFGLLDHCIVRLEFLERVRYRFGRLVKSFRCDRVAGI